MAGSIFWQELASSSIFTVSSAVGTTPNNSSISLGNIDCRSGGSTGLVEKFVLRAELITLWNVTTGMSVGGNAADLFLLPAIDGTNFPDFDATNTPGSASGIGPNAYVGSFIFNKAPTASTAVRMVSQEIDLYPRLYQVFLTNRSGQTNVTSQLRVVADQFQFS